MGTENRRRTAWNRFSVVGWYPSLVGMVLASLADFGLDLLDNVIGSEASNIDLQRVVHALGVEQNPG